MQLRKKSLERFKELYKRHFNVELSDQETERKAKYLLEFFRVIYGLPGVEEFFDNKIEGEEKK